MRYLYLSLLTATSLCNCALAGKITTIQSSWNCKISDDDRSKNIFCRDKKRIRIIPTYKHTVSNNWLIVNNFLLQKVTDIEISDLTPKDNARYKKQMAERKNGSLIYNLEKGEWMNSELRLDNLPMANMADINPTYMSNAQPISKSYILLDFYTEVPGGGGSSTTVLSRDGRKMLGFAPSYANGNVSPNQVSEDEGVFYGINDMELHLWSSHKSKSGYLNYIGYFILNSSDAKNINNKNLKIYNNIKGLKLCYLKKCKILPWNLMKGKN